MRMLMQNAEESPAGCGGGGGAGVECSWATGALGAHPRPPGPLCPPLGQGVRSLHSGSVGDGLISAVVCHSFYVFPAVPGQQV